MRQKDHSITPAVVRARVMEPLRAAFDWQPRRAVSVDQLLQLLLLAATAGASLFHVVSRFFPFSHDSARRAVSDNCSSVAAVAAGLNRSLQQVFRWLRPPRGARWYLAIDTHFVPYYGQRTAAVVGGPRKAGTKYFFGYATAMVVDRHRRYTVALEALSPQARPHEIVRRLLDRVAECGLTIHGVTADSWFDSGDTLRLLQQRRLDYAIPLRRKGRGSNARNRLFERPPDTVHTATWKTEVGARPVTTAVYVCRRSARQGRRGAPMVIAYAAWSHGLPLSTTRSRGRQARQLYRARFGIETSYRQKNQARAATTSRDPAYRLLLEGLAHLIRQVWVLLTEQLARHTRPRPGDLGAKLRLATLVRWLDDTLRNGLTELRSIPLRHRT